MGNCAGKPMDLIATKEAPLPAEEATAQSTEIVSDPKEQDVGSETKKEEHSAKANESAAEAKPVEKEAVIEEAKPYEPVVAVEAKAEAKTKAESEAKVKTPVVEKPKEEPKVEAQVATA